MTVDTPAVSQPVGVLALNRRSRRLRWALLIGFGLQVAWRLHLSLPQTGPVVHPDEDGYLLVARVLAGGPQATLPSWSMMRPMGYPLLLAPIYWFVRQPVHVFIGVHIVNALVSAANFPLLYLLGRRLFGTSRVWTAVLAFVLGCLPALVFYSNYALTEVLLPVLLELLLLAVHAMLTGRRPVLAAVVAGLVAAYAANTHVRGLVLLALLGGLLAIARWRGWLNWPVTLAAAASALGVYVVGAVVNAWLVARLFQGAGAFNVDSRMFQRLTTFSGLFRVFGDGLGQIWYLGASTYGLAALGLAATLAILVRREEPLETRIVLGFAFLATIGVALATAAGIPDEGRINNHFYGRYVSVFAGVWALVAITVLARSTWRRSAALVAGAVLIEVGSLGVTWLYAHQQFPREAYYAFDAAELAFLNNDNHDRLHLLASTGLSIAGMLVAVLIFARGSIGGAARGWNLLDYRQRLVAVGMVGLLGLNLVAARWITNSITENTQRAQYRPGPVELVRDAHVPPGSSIEEATNVAWDVNQRHQLEVYWEQLDSFDPAGAPPGRPTYVVALASWPGDRYGYKVDRVEPQEAWVLWRR
jgi:hypothetical protein